MFNESSTTFTKEKMAKATCKLLLMYKSKICFKTNIQQK
jgi:hypothetical protein